MGSRAGKAGKWAFWSLWALAHAAAGAGAVAGGWILGIAADGMLLLAEGDLLLLLLALAWMALRREGSAAMGAFALGAACCAFALAIAPMAAHDPWRPAGAGSMRLLQGNTEGKGNPVGWEGYDVVALQELWDGPLAAPEGIRLAVGASPGRYDAAIYTRWPVLDSGTVGEPIRGWTQGVWARLMSPSGPVTVASVHTRSPTSAQWSADRDEFLGVLAAWAAKRPKGEPLVVTGDWNATPAGRPFREFLSSGSWSQEPDPWSPTWHSELARFGAGFRIDRTLGANGAKVAAWRALPMGLSDHLFSESAIELP